MEDRAARAPLIVEFLNNWNCRLKATETRMMLGPWIDRLPGVADEMSAL